MKISASFLSIKENIKENIKRLDCSNIDYIHVDIMDNVFVPNLTRNFNEINELLKDTYTPKDVHLMVSDVISYIDDFAKLNPEFITFHLEAVDNVKEVIDYIKEKNIKVGISIKPNTDVIKLVDYLDLVDLVLIMSVEPGFGGQKFIDNSLDKIEKLNSIRKHNNYNFFIEVDGGINASNISDLTGVDIAVVGSYITNSSDYSKTVDELKNIIGNNKTAK